MAYSRYLVYLGLPVFMGTPTEKVRPCVVAIIALSAVVFAAITAIVRVISAAVFLRVFF